MDPIGPEPGPLPGQSPHLSKQALFIGRPTRLITLCSSRLIEYTTRLTLRYLVGPQTATYLVDRPPSAFGAYQFPFAASLRISMSRAWSATNFFNREFSFSRAFNCLTISGCIIPEPSEFALGLIAMSRLAIFGWRRR